MTLQDLAFLFNRAWAKAFDIKKGLLLFVTLFCSGLLLLVFKDFYFVTLFFISGLLMGVGVIVIREFSQMELVWKALSLALPFLLLSILIWVMRGVFFLLKSIPYLGTLVGALLAFIPFILYFVTLFLLIFALLILFFTVPTLALTRQFEFGKTGRRIASDPFSHLLLLVIGILPFWVMWKAIIWTLQHYGATWFLEEAMLLIPIAALLTLPVLFFFNFACEAFQILNSD